MNKLFSLAALGLAATGLTLVAPEQSQAQPPRLSVQFGYNSGGGHYGRRGYNNYNNYPRYSSYGNSYNRGRSSCSPFGGYGGYGNNYRRPTIVHPERYHWTPRRGLHTHGHLHVPHGNHYHTVPY